MAKKRRIVSRNFYNQKTLHKEREYGFYWYSWLWKLARPILIFCISLLVVSGMVLSVWNSLYESYLMPVNPDDNTEVTFRIDSGNSVTKIALNLEKQNLLRSTGVFKLLVQFQGVTNRIHPGEYLLKPNMGPTEIIEILTSGSAITERTITIIPGWTIGDIADYFLKVGAIDDREAFLDRCRDAEPFREVSYQVQQAVDGGRMDDRTYALEGYLAPDTYRVLISATEDELIGTLLRQTEIVLDRLYDTSPDESENAFETDLT